jgi:hypothetical protein
VGHNDIQHNQEAHPPDFLGRHSNHIHTSTVFEIVDARFCPQ